MAKQSVITLIKYQALGNDYLFINSSKFKRPTASFVKKVCHRNFGIGSDGVLYGGKSDDGIFSIEIINPDGSIAEMSGNGIRIFARAMVDLGLAQVEDSFNIRTIKKEVSVTINDLNSISVNMGKPLFIDDNIAKYSSFFDAKFYKKSSADRFMDIQIKTSKLIMENFDVDKDINLENLF